MGFEEKRRRRAGKFGEVNDFAGRVFQMDAQPSQRLIAGGGNKNSGGKKKQGAGGLPASYCFVNVFYRKRSLIN